MPVSRSRNISFYIVWLTSHPLLATRELPSRLGLRIGQWFSDSLHLLRKIITYNYPKSKRGEEEKLSYKFYFNIERLITNPKTSHFLEKNIDTNLQSFDNHFSLQEKLRWTLFIPVLKANSIPKERGRSTMKLSWKSRSRTGHREPLSVV